MPSGFVPNAAGYREFLHSAQLSAELRRRAEAVAASARAAAPKDSGEYANSISVVVEQHPSRVVAHVVATAKHSMIVEANTGNLARALDAAGG